MRSEVELDFNCIELSVLALSRHHFVRLSHVSAPILMAIETPSTPSLIIDSVVTETSIEG